MKKPTAEFYKKNEAIFRAVGENKIVVSIDDSHAISLDYLGWPTVCKGEGNTLYAAASLRISHVDPFSVTVFFKSCDGGESWSEPKIINDTTADDRDAGILYMGNGRLIVTFFTIPPRDFIEGGEYSHCWGECENALREAKIATWKSLSDEDNDEIEGSFALFSDDYGETWSAPVRIPLTSPHGPTLMQDGKTLLLLGKSMGTERCDGFRDLPFGYHSAISRDYGRTWEYTGTIPLPEVTGGWGYWEPYGIQLKSGEFLGAVRTGNNDNSVIKDNANRSLGIMITHSKDGKSWSLGEKIPNVCGAPAHLLELSGGEILLTYSHRLPHCGARGRVSYDGGYTWSEEEIIISESRDPHDYDLGYPSTAVLDDGTLVTTYYQAYAEGEKPTVLYTRWRLFSEEK